MEVKISGFTFVHDALAGGYPLVEAIQTVQPYVDEIVVVDMESTDGTTELLHRLGVRVIKGRWGDQAGETLAKAHALHEACANETIIHFEADEVYDSGLLWIIRGMVENGETDLSVYRLQLEQNFQRCRWYPEPVHRVFRRGTVTKQGHTTDRHNQAKVLGPEYGFLWDCTNCFCDNWLQRVEQQADLWHGVRQYIMTPLHVLHEAKLDDRQSAEILLKEPHWTWKTTPFNIPEILRPLVGMTRYEARL